MKTTVFAAKPFRSACQWSAALLMAFSSVAAAQTIVFQDTFQSGNLSTLNPTAASPGTLTSTRTAYEIGSSKNATGTSIAAGAFTLATGSTGSGYTEAQARFAATPVTLDTAGEYIEVYYTFTDTTDMFNNAVTTGGNNMQINIGLYNSGGSAPTNGTLLWNSGLVSGSATAVNGGTKDWVGYTAQFARTPPGFAANASAIGRRPAQTGANNLNQAIGIGSGYLNNANIVTMSGVVGQPTLTVGNQYTLHLRITYVNATTLAVTNTLYEGAGIGGTVYSAGGWTGRLGGTTTTILTTSFDALEVGIRPTTSTATTLQINSITVATYDPNASSPPAITGLTNQTVEAGSTVTLSPVVTGSPIPNYQWQENWVDMAGQTSASLTLANVTTNQNGYIYSLTASNSQGVVTSNMTLTVVAPVFSDMSVTGMSPANGATGICYDTPLTVTFSDTVSLGTTGSIKIYNAASPAAPVDTIDVALGAVQQRTFPGDGQSFSYQTIEISGNTVKIYPHFNVMTANQTYYVTIDPKAFKDSGGTNFAGLLNTNAWRFSTKSAPADPVNPVVNADGSADFLTVQGAVNSLASGTNATQRVITIKNGLYREIVNIAGKHNVTFRGQSRHGAVISFPNNATFQSANGGTTHARMNFKVYANDVVLDSLTVSNSTPQGGSQAEALMIQTGAARCIVNNSELVSRQDTILANVNTSQGYFYKSTIKGNFDYIWGGGNLFFDQCEIRTIAGSSSYNVTAARTTTSATQSSSFPWANPGGTYTANGMSFVDCTFTADAGVANITLAGGNGTAGNLASWARCKFAGSYVTPSGSLFSGNYLFWQYENTDLAGTTPVSFSALTTLPDADSRLLAATNAPTWFYGWVPQLAPNILTNPAGAYLAPGGTVSLSVAATGIPEPAYQWQKNGTNVPGATNATLSISNAQSGDAATYSVVVSNSAGTAVSSAAVLVVNTAPVATNMSAGTVADAPISIAIAKVLAHASDADGDPLTLSGTSATSTNGGTVTLGAQNITYTPVAGFTGADQFTYTVSDGRGGLATGTITVTVSPPNQGFNQVAAQNLGGGTIRLSYLGIPGNSYALDWRTNLSAGSWIPLMTNAAAANGWLIFTNTSSEPQNFYRTRFVP